MPTVVQLGNVKIQIFPNDHNPPHFHVSTPDHGALILLSSLAISQGEITKRDYETVLAWVLSNENKKKLEDEWSRLNER